MKRSSLVLSIVAAVSLSFTPAKADFPFQGLYVGVHGGYEWQDTGGSFDGTSLTKLDLDGPILGAQLGYNVQSSWFLMGVEVDASTSPVDGNSVSSSGASGTSTLSSDMSYLTSARARLGVVASNVLFYGTIGWAATKFELTDNGPAGFEGTKELRENGLVYGGGIEWKLTTGLSLRTEYLHYDVGSSTRIPSSFPDANAGDRISFKDIDVARAAINVSLNPW